MKMIFDSKSDHTLQKALGYIYVPKNFHGNNFKNKHSIAILSWSLFGFSSKMGGL